MKKLLFALLTVIVSGNIAGAEVEKIVSVDGAVTEIIYALGEEDRLVGVDTTSVYPQTVHTLPKVGYKRALSSEGILSLEPDLVIATKQAGPPTVLKMIEKSGVQLVTLEEDYSMDGIYAKIEKVSKLLGISEKGDNLIRTLKEQAQESLDQDSKESKPRVLFVFHASSGSPLVSGTNTAAHSMIEYAGGVNVVTQYEGYKPLNPEFMGEVNPDILLTTSMVVDSLGGLENFKKLPGINLTRAAEADDIIVMDTMYLLGFTPRTPAAIKELSKELRSRN